MMGVKAVIAVGSNYGERRYNILRAITFLENCCRVIRKSDIYETPDCLGTGMPYLNSVIEILTDRNEEELNSSFKLLECKSGRDSIRRKRGEVPLDIDIVVWDGAIRRPSDYKAAYFRIGYHQLERTYIPLSL